MLQFSKDVSPHKAIVLGTQKGGGGDREDKGTSALYFAALLESANVTLSHRLSVGLQSLSG